MATAASDEIVYEVECRLDPSAAAEFDAWLPGHVQAVLACEGLGGAEIFTADDDADGRAVRRVQYRLAGAAALRRHLDQEAAGLRAEAAARFGDALSCSRRVLAPLPAAIPAEPPLPCQNCEAPVTGPYCAQCGQAAGTHMLSVAEVARDVVHSGLHLDSRAWRTLRSLLLRPGELSREFIAGRRQRFLPPFRLYLIVSLFFFALSALLPDLSVVRIDKTGEQVVAPVILRTPEDPSGGPPAPSPPDQAAPATAAEAPACDVRVGWPAAARLLTRACLQLAETDGRHLDRVFLATAPKLMFVFLPLMAAVATLFYWRPRRWYVEHLVLFLHLHAFAFLWLAAMTVLGAITALPVPLVGLLGILNVALVACLPWYVFRAMRVVYGDGGILTLLKMTVLGLVYFMLLGITMAFGVVYSILSL